MSPNPELASVPLVQSVLNAASNAGPPIVAVPRLLREEAAGYYVPGLNDNNPVVLRGRARHDRYLTACRTYDLEELEDAGEALRLSCDMHVGAWEREYGMRLLPLIRQCQVYRREHRKQYEEVLRFGLENTAWQYEMFRHGEEDPGKDILRQAYEGLEYADESTNASVLLDVEALHERIYLIGYEVKWCKKHPNRVDHTRWLRSEARKRFLQWWQNADISRRTLEAARLPALYVEAYDGLKTTTEFLRDPPF